MLRMCDEYVEKTIFKTHYGHYELKLMPFSLTNTLATFQALMNNMLESYLQRLFFYDILIYNSILDLHITHHKTILEALHNNQLFAKRSKFTFCEDKVEYLEHIICSK